MTSLSTKTSSIINCQFKTSSQKKLFCTFTIVKLEEGMDWYLNACNICQKELLKIEKNFNCGSCFRNIPVSEKSYDG